MASTPDRDDATFRYISLANAIPALTRDEELDLARAYLTRGDQSAKRRIIRANLRQVIPQAVRFRRSGIPVSELVAQGNLALVAALDRFDPDRGYRFATYAKHWIRAEMLGMTLRQRSMVSGGRGPLRAKYVYKLRREFGELMLRTGDRASALDHLAPRFRRTPTQLAEILDRIDSPDTSIDLRVGSGEGVALVDLMASETQPTDEVVAERQSRADLRTAVRAASADLNPRERFIVERRLMADDESRLSLAEVGRHFGVSRERARQLEAGLKAKLRKRLSAVAEAHRISAAA